MEKHHVHQFSPIGEEPILEEEPSFTGNYTAITSTPSSSTLKTATPKKYNLRPKRFSFSTPRTPKVGRYASCSNLKEWVELGECSYAFYFRYRLFFVWFCPFKRCLRHLNVYFLCALWTITSPYFRDEIIHLWMKQCVWDFGSGCSSSSIKWLRESDQDTYREVTIISLSSFICRGKPVRFLVNPIINTIQIHQPSRKLTSTRQSRPSTRSYPWPRSAMPSQSDVAQCSTSSKNEAKSENRARCDLTMMSSFGMKASSSTRPINPSAVVCCGAYP